MSVMFYMGPAGSASQVPVEDFETFERELSREAKQTVDMLTALQPIQVIRPSTTTLQPTSTEKTTTPRYTTFQERSSNEDEKEKTVSLSNAQIQAEKTNRFCCTIL